MRIKMFGYTQPNNDIYVFFENNEIERLERGKIKGTYFNIKDPSKIGLLEAWINNNLSLERIKISRTKNNEGFITHLIIEMKQNEYEILREKRTAGTHEGFCHIELLNANNLTFNDQNNFIQLKYWEKDYSIKI